MDVMHANSIYLSSCFICFHAPHPRLFSPSCRYLLSLSRFFCPSKCCLLYPASHHYSAKRLCFDHIKESFSILLMQTLLLFLHVLLWKSLCKVLLSIPSPFFPSHISIVLPFSKMFLRCTHTSSCVRTATRCLNRKQQIHLRHHIKARICTCTDSAQGSEADYVSDAVCMLTA